MIALEDEHDSDGAEDADGASPDTLRLCDAETLTQEGWKRQFATSGERLREAIENYCALGLEVKTMPLKELDCGGCTLCFDNEVDETMMIFTRARAE